MYISVCLGHIGVWVRVLEGLLSGVQRPSSDVNLLTERGGISLQERVHVLPTVQVSNAADLGLHHGLGSVASAVSENKALDVGGLDLAAVVDDIASWCDHNLGGIQTGEIKLRVSKRHPDLIGLGCFADAAHFLRVGGETVLAVLLQQRQALLVGDLPGPVGVAGDPYSYLLAHYVRYLGL